MAVDIAKKDLEIWADYLLDYSIGGVDAGDLIMIKGEHISWPLINTLQEKIIQKGGRPDINLVAPDNDRGKVWGAAMARYGKHHQIREVPDWQVQRYNEMTKYIEVLGAENPEWYSDLPDETLTEIMKADEPLKNIRLLKPWVLTLFPTQGFADLEGMSLEDYADFIVRASTVDPQLLDDLEEEIYQQLSKTKNIRIETHCEKMAKDLVLEMSIEGRNVVKCAGERNFPDGEVFTSPNADTVEGEIYVDLPVSYSGTTIQGIYLKFEGGKITGYSAEQGNETLTKIIETDEGSHRLGEVALGMNNGMDKVLKHPLFVEKVGGTLHIAIGASYPETFTDDPASDKGKSEADEYFRQGKLNRSAQHVDIVTDFRPGGAGRAVYLDDVKLEIQDNLWVVPE